MTSRPDRKDGIICNPFKPNRQTRYYISVTGRWGVFATYFTDAQEQVKRRSLGLQITAWNMKDILKLFMDKVWQQVKAHF